MMPTEAVTYITPDGVERSLRFTLGARKRIAEKFGAGSIMDAFTRHGDEVLADIAYAMMHDQHGKPPEDLDVAHFAEMVEDPMPLLAAILSAATRGAVPKNEMEALLRKAQEAKVEELIGSTFGASPNSVSNSQPLNSGGSPTESSTPSADDTESVNESPITVPA